MFKYVKKTKIQFDAVDHRINKWLKTKLLSIILTTTHYYKDKHIIY